MNRKSQKAAGVLFGQIWERFTSGDTDFEGPDVQEMLVHAGVVDKVEFDPDEHTGETEHVEPGDDWFVLNEIGRGILEAGWRKRL